MNAYEKAAGIGGITAAALGVLSLAGWASGDRILASFGADYIPMAPTTAVVFIALGAMLLLFSAAHESKAIRLVCTIAAAACLVYCLLILIAYFTRIPVDTGETAFSGAGTFDGVALGRMSPLAAVSFILSASALLILTVGSGGGAGELAFAAFFFNFVILLGYLCHAPILYGGTIIPIALNTGLAFIFLNGGLACAAGPGQFPIRPFAGPSMRAKLLRSFLPLMLGAVVADSAGYRLLPASVKLSPAICAAIVAVFFVVLLSVVASRIAKGIGNSIDDAQRKQRAAEEIMLRREKDFRFLFINNPNPMWVYDAETLRFLEVNAKALSVYGYTKEEFLNMRISDIRPEEDVPPLTQQLKESRADIQFSGEWRHRLKNGNIITVEIVSERLRFNDRDGVLVVAKDVTSRNETEKALKETNRRLADALTELRQTQHQIIRQERLRSLGTMASGIAHDFNNTLSPILGYSDLLLQHPENLANKEKVARALQIINSAAQDAGKVVNRLRQFYRQQEIAEPFEPVSLDTLIEDTVLLTEPRWRSQALVEGATINIATEVEPVPPVMGNESELREALTNLVLNAVDAMPKGGTVTLKARMERGMVFVEVCDTGTGMSEQVQAECFKPFFTTKGEKGTGLGLPMVAGIVKRHDGTIRVKSEPGKGTAFIMTFPVKEKIESKPARAAIQAQAPKRTLRVLLVDDEAGVREILSEYLTGEGHMVEMAVNGKDGLKKFNPNLFDLAIVDRAMPEMGGEELAGILKKMAPQLPIILLTGSADLAMDNETPDGIDLVLGKPIALKSLMDAVAKVAG